MESQKGETGKRGKQPAEKGKTKEKQQKKGKENEKDGAVERHRSQKK